MMHGPTFSGNLFFDPLATNLGNNLVAGLATTGTADPAPARHPGAARKRGVQSAAEHKALRAASLSKVSRDLERMLRERKR
ncbi:hypothetical protein DFO47_103369 [Arthrobacter sp. AG258]|uniref:hypothetical protein n=1 Tax=Arthrobacter sp. AG258 TaxID=2183899 RepID=UPI001061BFB0|nr:hypothetical protein [Arthrobacter sp. AG258]TDT81711.1 hypothetical protein DFO47_103369 [Arthrobacter sp. AG258]